MSAGIQSQITVAKETTWGVQVTPNKSIPVRPAGGIAIKENIQMIPAIKGQLQKNYAAIKGKVSYEGDYTMDMFADYPGLFLLSAFGTDTPALHSGETTVYDHVFTESIPKPSLTIEQAIAENTRRYSGCIVSGFKVAGKVGEMIEFTPTISAKTQASSSEVSAAFSTVPAFNHTQMAIKIGGSVIGEVENFELNFKNGLEMVYALGNVEPSFNSIAGGSEVSGKIELYLDATTIAELTNYINAANRSLEFIATGGAIGSAANYILDLLVPKAIYTAGETKVTDSHNLLSIEFNGIFDTGGTNKLLACTLTNLLASY